MTSRRIKQRISPLPRWDGDVNTCILEVTDSTTTTLSADFLLRGTISRDVTGLLGRLVDQFQQANAELVRSFGVELLPRFDGRQVGIQVTAGTTVGAFPLRSPISGRYEFGLVVRPRHEWLGLGGCLAGMGWKVLPAPLSLPNLPRSERRIPPWVLSTIVLKRIEVLLTQVERRFEIIDEDLTAPKGHVDWQKYATRSGAHGLFNRVPCRYPQLMGDAELRAAIRFVLQRQHASLESQRSAGVFVTRLMEWCQQLLRLVEDVPAKVPTSLQMERWSRRRLPSDSFIAGLDAIAWTVEERGLAGTADLHGLPWQLPMEAFFEAWVETALQQVARKVGGTIRSGRERTTVIPISWDPPFSGSQKSLVPDIVLETARGPIIVDAKYKEHWEELAEHHWGRIEQEVRERHRSDLFQILAYANTIGVNSVIACLVYPCRLETWHRLREKNRLFHRAMIGAQGRIVTLILAALPMSSALTETVPEFSREFNRALGD